METSPILVRSDSSFEAQFRAAFATGFGPLYRYLNRLSGDPALASDIAQDTFIRLYQRGEMPDNFRAWLVAVSRNLFRDERRRSSRRRQLLDRRAPESTLGDASPAPDEQLLSDERRQAVRHALADLPERDRELLLLRHEGFSYRDLAVALGLTESSVGTLLARAKAAFRRALDGKLDASA